MFSGACAVHSGALPISERRLAAATHRAVEAAGGLAACRAETGLSHAHLSRCGSLHERDSITIRDALRVDRLGAGVDGHPEILGALASELGAVVIILPDHAGDESCLQTSVIEITVEVGDVARKIAEAFAGTSAGGVDVTGREAEAALAQVVDLERATAKLRRQLERIVEQPP